MAARPHGHPATWPGADGYDRYDGSGGTDGYRGGTDGYRGGTDGYRGNPCPRPDCR